MVSRAHPLLKTVLFSVCLLLVCVVGTRAECIDAGGRPVIELLDRTLQDIGFASFGPRGESIIRYNPDVMAKVSPQTRRFFMKHECGHHALAHAIRNIPFSAEQEADCYAVVTLVKNGEFDSDDVAAVQRDLNGFGQGDWTHLPGPQRAINLNRCLESSSSSPGGRRGVASGVWASGLTRILKAHETAYKSIKGRKINQEYWLATIQLPGVIGQCTIDDIDLYYCQTAIWTDLARAERSHEETVELVEKSLPDGWEGEEKTPANRNILASHTFSNSAHEASIFVRILRRGNAYSVEVMIG